MDKRPLSVLLEVCVGSLADARAAVSAGADRIELCSALELGGLTPSLALIEQVIGEVDVPVVVMIRPRAGGFHYSGDEFQCMLRDAKLALDSGASGIVFGCLNASGEIDATRSRHLLQLSKGHDGVFHRAFDFVPDQSNALDRLMDLGATRVLTTGGASNAIEGIDRLNQLIEQAGDRMQILPGGGITSANVSKLINDTECTQVHVGASKADYDKSITADDASRLCDLAKISAGQLRVVDEQQVANIANELARIAK